jgi:serine/threonine protein kinase/tetratricopeptide (TPR) repeat protein
MTDDHWDRLRALFDRVRGMPEAERRPLLDRELAEEPGLRRDLDALLENSAASIDFLADRNDPVPDSVIGPYRLLHRIGEGGFGVVYLAEQLHPVRRRVALKLVKPGMDTRQVLARFRTEQQALAIMNHPGIAQVFDAGETDRGRPYFVMEYVPGVPVTAFCDAERLSIPERLALFLQVCDAVHHAHQKGVIHRDLKPLNMLVARRDGSAMVKVIDFGIVKATGDVPIHEYAMTRDGMVLGTVGYMSPEQLGAIDEPVDTRSDIYSLGVVLYELLADELPFGRERIRRAGWVEAVRMVVDEEPTPPAVRAEKTDTAAAAARRSTDSRTLLRVLKGDLRWIVLRALEKDPDRRYPSASELAADIRRHLADEPVLAAAPGTTYRLRKYARRHRVGITAAALVLLAVVAGGISAAIGFGRAVRAEREARREAAASSEVAAFLVGLFHASGPGEHEVAPTARSLLDQGVRRIEAAPPTDPHVRARLLGAISDSYLNLESWDEGIRLKRHALATVEGARPRNDIEVARYMDQLANGFSMAGLTDSIPPLVERTIALLSAAPGGDPGLLAGALYRKARYRMDAGALAEADSLIYLALTTATSAPAPDPAQLSRIHATRALVAAWRFQPDRALPDFRLALEYAIRADEPLRAALTHGSLAITFISLGEVDSALVHARTQVDMARKLYAPDHTSLAEACSDLAQALQSAGRYPEAITAQEEAVRILRAREPGGTKLPFALAVLGAIHGDAGEIEAAIPATAEALELFRARLGSGHFRVAETTANRAREQWSAGRSAAADTLFRDAIGILDALGDRTILSPAAREDYGNLCLQLDRTAEAESLYARAAAALDSTNGAMRPLCGDNLIARARLLARQGRREEARSLAAAGFRMRSEDLEEDDPLLLDPWLCLAEIRWLNGDAAAAVESLARAGRCGATDADLAGYPKIVALRDRPDYPLASSP